MKKNVAISSYFLYNKSYRCNFISLLIIINYKKVKDTYIDYNYDKYLKF